MLVNQVALADSHMSIYLSVLIIFVALIKSNQISPDNEYLVTEGKKVY
jgi:hypothetical protein